MHSGSRWSFAALVVLLLNAPARAQGFEPGGIVVTSARVGTGAVVELFDRNGAVTARLATAPGIRFGEAAFSREGMLYVLSPTGVRRIDRAAGVTAQFGFGGFSLVMGGRDEVYVTQQDFFVYPFSLDGTPLPVLQMPRRAAAADIAADGCTLVFATPGEHELARYDVCRRVPLPRITVLPNAANAVRVLRDGSVLVAIVPSGQHPPMTLHVDPAGTVLRTYPYAFSALALDPDRQTFWGGAGSILTRINIATGEVAGTSDTGLIGISGLAIVGDPRAAFDAAGIPTLGSIGAIGLAAILLFLALTRTQ